MTAVVISQPTYIPWLGYFELLNKADVFVALDVVQYERRSWQSRNRLRQPNGEPFWLSVPIVRAPRNSSLNAITISPDTNWGASHLRSIELSLGACPYFGSVQTIARDALTNPGERLVDLNLKLIGALCRELDIRVEVIRSRDLRPVGNKSSLLIDICSKLGASKLLSAAGSAEYIAGDLEQFADGGIEVEFQTWKHPTYRQQGRDFISHLSALDAIANVGSAVVRSFFETEQ